MSGSRWITAVAVALVAAGCSRYPTADRDAVREVRIISGDSQTVRVNSITPRPIVIEVLDAQQRAVRYTPLFWSVEMSDGTDAGQILAALAETDLKGRAEALVELGEEPGEYILRVLAGRYEAAPGDTVEVAAEAVIFGVADPIK